MERRLGKSQGVTVTDSQVAIKKVHEGVKQHAVDDFLKEARLMQAIRPHSNVVQVRQN